MAESSKIEWCDHTFNPWVGCNKVSSACDHCYAEGWAKRTGQAHLWAGERRRTSPANWQQPVAWNHKAEAAGIRARVFCASLADVFDNQVPSRWRDDLWHLISRTPYLDWLLLTKRPQNITKMLPDVKIGTPEWGDGWPNVWLGTTVENQDEADRRIPHLLAAPAAKRFLSCEPLLGPVLLDYISVTKPTGIEQWNCLSRQESERAEAEGGDGGFIDWVIVGGESGPGARPMHPDWARALRDQCYENDTSFFFKQWGEWAPYQDHCAWYQTARHSLPMLNWNGKAWTNEDLTDMPPDVLRVGKKRAGAMLDGREWREMPGGAARCEPPRS